MKQTVEEAARDAIHAHYKCNGEYPCGERDYCEHCNGHNTAFDCCECGADEFKEGFISGAEWQSKQSPWISVKERLPEELESVLVGTNYEGRYYYEVAFVMNGKWVCHNSKPIYWMPIPSFDDILEANRDVLERIKEKGD
jgi:hypothetical protein